MSTASEDPPTLDSSRPLSSAARAVVVGVRAAAFWTAALLPLALLVALFAGVADPQPNVIGGAVGLNLLCAVIGHGHSPN
jgi:hypothetical protein